MAHEIPAGKLLAAQKEQGLQESMSIIMIAGENKGEIVVLIVKMRVNILL